MVGSLVVCNSQILFYTLLWLSWPLDLQISFLELFCFIYPLILTGCSNIPWEGNSLWCHMDGYWLHGWFSLFHFWSGKLCVPYKVLINYNFMISSWPFGLHSNNYYYHCYLFVIFEEEIVFIVETTRKGRTINAIDATY